MKTKYKMAVTETKKRFFHEKKDCKFSKQYINDRYVIL